MDSGGVIRSIENLGEQELPYKMIAHTEKFTHARWVTTGYTSYYGLFLCHSLPLTYQLSLVTYKTIELRFAC